MVDKSEYIESYYQLGILKHRFIRPKLYSYLKNGATLTANRIVNEPIINNYAKQISRFTGFPTICSAYIAFGEKSSFRPHWDSRDIFVLQTVGKKRWLIYPPSFKNPLYMHKSLHLGEQYPCPTDPIMDIILEEGDILYLPRGYWHDPLPLGMETVHLTIAIYPATGLEYIEWLHNKLSYVDEVRQSLSSWQEDKVSIENLADKISNFIKNERSYKEFMNEFVGNQRLETNLNLEILGDVKTSILPDSAKLSLNSNQHYNEDSQFIIANGVKLNLDSDLEPIVVYIAQNPGVLVGDIFKLFNYIDRDKISASLYNLCINDVFEILEY
ncbi:hypothetical protein C0160_08640 [Moraxella catarrhalis]|nr:cupin [Moraxella catarrhalis]MPW73546.1 cupin [Moraxella catarrhalis]MPW80091.1 cupin [Moraxella catarrhalis]MPW81899.1 cupin [Moraxella catarrhalis]MPX05676.1 hypothetical protein [Moraxella catarrhalis]